MSGKNVSINMGDPTRRPGNTEVYDLSNWSAGSDKNGFLDYAWNDGSFFDFPNRPRL